MKALVHHEYGTAEVLHLASVERPEIRDHEVLIRVAAASVHVARRLLGPLAAELKEGSKVCCTPAASGLYGVHLEIGTDLHVPQQERPLIETLAAQPRGDLVVALAGVARPAGWDDVGEGVPPTAGDGQDAVAL